MSAHETWAAAEKYSATFTSFPVDATAEFDRISKLLPSDSAQDTLLYKRQHVTCHFSRKLRKKIAFCEMMRSPVRSLPFCIGVEGLASRCIAVREGAEAVQDKDVLTQRARVWECEALQRHISLPHPRERFQNGQK